MAVHNKINQEPNDYTNDCCRKEVKRLWDENNKIVYYVGICPKCKKFIGLTYSSPEYIKRHLTNWGLIN